MRCILATALSLSLCSIADAQAFELFAMTTPNTVIDMDNVGPVGPTTVAAIAAAGNNGAAPLSGISLVPNTAVAGIYDTNTELGRALARGPGNSLELVDPNGAFEAFDAVISFSQPCTEIGLAIGDWLNTMDLEFAFRGTTVATLTTSPYASGSPKFVRVLTSFDSVTVRASFPVGNWVITQLHVQTSFGWQPFGTGCTGSNGIPTLDLVTAPRLGGTYALEVDNMPAAPGLYAMVLGFDTTFFVGLGPLPLDLGALGAPGCALLVDAGARTFALHNGNTAQFALTVPNEPSFAGIEFANQAWVLDAPANALGVTVSNGCFARVQP